MNQLFTPKMQVFIFIWLGQVLSLLGSGLTNFALGVWAYQQTQSVTLYSLVLVCATLPSILISPVAGVVVDRFSRRWVMIFSDVGAGLSTLFIALMIFTGHLEIWQVCISTAISSIFNAFQVPAYSAATTLLVPKESLDRASGMIQLGQGISHLISPVLGGILLSTIQLQGVIMIDAATFLLGTIPLFLIRFPEVKSIINNANKLRAKDSFWQNIFLGWNYLTDNPGLLILFIFFAVSNFMVGAVGMLVNPLILSYASPATLGIVLSIAGVGMLIGSILISIRGLPKHLVLTILGFQMLGGLCILTTGIRASAQLAAVSTFLFFLGWPLINTSSEVIFQKKVPLHLQGRVFAIRQMITEISFPLAYIVAGPLADKVFEPLMNSDGSLATTIGHVIGNGPGRGIGLMFVIMGVLTMLLSLITYNYPRIRLLERDLPDAI